MMFVRVSQKNSFKEFLEMEKKLKEKLAKEAAAKKVSEAKKTATPDDSKNKTAKV